MKDWVNRMRTAASARSSYWRVDSARVRGVAMSLAFSVIISSCDTSSPTGAIATPITGRTFRVVSVDGRSFPTTLGMLAITVGGCPSVGTVGILLAFHADSSLVETVQYATGGATMINAHFAEPRTGETAIVGGGDTASFQRDTLRLRLSGVTCGRELLLAVPRV